MKFCICPSVVLVSTSSVQVSAVANAHTHKLFLVSFLSDVIHQMERGSWARSSSLMFHMFPFWLQVSRSSWPGFTQHPWRLCEPRSYSESHSRRLVLVVRHVKEVNAIAQFRSVLWTCDSFSTYSFDCCGPFCNLVRFPLVACPCRKHHELTVVLSSCRFRTLVCRSRKKKGRRLGLRAQRICSGVRRGVACAGCTWRQRTRVQRVAAWKLVFLLVWVLLLSVHLGWDRRARVVARAHLQTRTTSF